jgi:hypothetical protein
VAAIVASGGKGLKRDQKVEKGVFFDKNHPIL